MTNWTLIAQSLRFYWRTNLGVALGAAVGTAILVGALVVGDSVRHTLRELARLRLGQVEWAMATQDRFFRSALADELAKHLEAPTAAVLKVRGSAIHNEEETRANRVQVLGVNETFWALAPPPGLATMPMRSSGGVGVALNVWLAKQLQATVGSTVVLRVERPSLVPHGAPLSTAQKLPIAMRLKVTAIVSDQQFGRFSLQANQVPPLTAFIPLEQLQTRMGKNGKANLLLIGSRENNQVRAERANLFDMPVKNALRSTWQLADVELELHARADRSVAELRTARIFLDPPIATAARTLPGANEILTYFVNQIEHGERQTPYSMVTALERSSLFPDDMADDQIIVNRWLADDLALTPGDAIDIRYYVLGPMRTLQQQTSRFYVRAVVPIEGESADPDLMPSFPGLAGSEHCREWEPGFPVDLNKIREKDEAYWTRYRGTPKAFIRLRTGKELWNNRFGNVTAVRYPLQDTTISEIRTSLRDAIDPATVGLFLLPVREQAQSATDQGLDFRWLFLGFSTFLLAAALLFMGMLFVFGVEQRAEQVGTLLALGYRPSRVRWLLLGEGLGIAIFGGAVGTLLALLYTKLVLAGLSTVWLKAVGSAAIRFTVDPFTLPIGALASVAVGVLTIWLVTCRQAGLPASQLLASDATGGIRAVTLQPPRWGWWLALLAGSGAIALTVLGLAREGSPSSSLFFGAGALALATGIGLSQALLLRLRGTSREAARSVGELGVRGATRRPGRSLATIILLSCGTFMITAVGAFHHHPKEAQQPTESGTGGFALIGETTLPVQHDLNSQAGREALGLASKNLDGVTVLPLRLREGEDASCLNLNRAQRPQLLGVDTPRLRSRGAFTFVKTTNGRAGREAWGLLTQSTEDGTVPAIGDQATVIWALGLKVGETMAYTDDHGRVFKLKIVGMTANTILQGHLVVDEHAFLEKFPFSGYQMFLIDVEGAKDRVDQVAKTLARSLRDLGLELTTTGKKMAVFEEVENTYISIFQALGGLGLILGSAGLGVVVMRNVLERRGELALFRAFGFRRRAVQWLILSEHWLLLGIGLVVGAAAAAIAVLPAFVTPGQTVPYPELALTISAVAVSGALWTCVATIWALHGPLLNALRSE